MKHGSKGMKRGRLIDLLTTLNKNEFKKLGDFVRSPFHNNRTLLVKLFDELAKHYPKFDPGSTDRSSLHQALFRGKEFNDLEIRRAMGQLTEVAERYLGWIELQRTPEELKLAQIRAFRSRKLNSHFQKSVGQARTILSQRKHGIDQLYTSYRVALEEEFFEDSSSGRRSQTRLQEVSDQLDRFYISSKLKQSCTAISYEQVFKHKYNIRLLPQVLDLLKTDEGLENPALLDLYRFGLLTMTDPDDESHFKSLVTILKKPLNIEITEERNLHVLGQNYCIRSVNSGKVEYFNELFKLYRLGLEKEVIQSDLSQFPPAFKNIVSTGLRVRQFQWVEHFIAEYSELLPKESRSDFENYNLARLRFDQEQFNEARKLLQTVEFKDVFITLNARVLLIKTCFELDQLELAEHQLKSFRTYISRQKNLSYHGNIFRANATFIAKLIRLNFNDEESVSRLRDEIRSEKNLQERSWLMAKLEQ